MHKTNALSFGIFFRSKLRITIGERGRGEKYELLRSWGKNAFKSEQKKGKGRKKGREKGRKVKGKERNRKKE